MDSDEPKVDHHTDAIDSVMDMFGEVMSREAVTAIVEHYGGDLNQSIDAIVNMSEYGGLEDEHINISPRIPEPTIHGTNDFNQHNMAHVPINSSTGVIANPPQSSTGSTHEQTAHSTNDVKTPTIAQTPNTPSTGAITKSSQSYSGASQNKTGFLRRSPKPKTETPTIRDLQFKQIIEYHNQGHRILILLRGVPGSGKSHLAQQLLQTMCPGAVAKTHILSSDDYFMVRGEYRYDRSRLSDAHDWNHNRVRHAASRGLSPIIVDNTHVKLWEMDSVARAFAPSARSSR